MVDLSGRTALVTGASKGIGLGIARVLALCGAKTVITARGEDTLAAAGELRKRGLTVSGVRSDVTDPASIQNLIRVVHDLYGPVDILVNDAGVSRVCRFEEMTDETRDMIFNVNVRGTWNCTRAVIRDMLSQRYGRIINVSSVPGALVSDPGYSAYAASKAAIVGLTKSLAVEYASRGITVNAILPGYVLTGMVERSAKTANPGDPKAAIRGIESGVPVGRLGTPDEAGYLAAFLASEEASYITGTTQVFDGGSTLPETNSMGIR